MLDNFSRYPHKHVSWFKYIVSLASSAATSEPMHFQNSEHFVWGRSLQQHVRKICWVGSAAKGLSALRLDARRDGQTVARSVFVCHYRGVSHAEWPKYKFEYALPDRQRLLLTAQSGGHRKPPASEPKGSHNAQRTYERYLALAQAEAQTGDRVAAENYYQYAEHYFRSMSSERGT